MDNRVIDNEYQRIGENLIQTEPELAYIKNSNVKIIYLSSDCPKKSKTGKTLGQCEKIQSKYKWGIPCDFTITVFEPNVMNLNAEQMRILIFHELLHIGVECDGGNETFFIKPHDLEDFKIIVNKFGTYWDR